MTADEEIVAVENAWVEAMVANDADRIASFIADDWVIVHEKGISDRESLIGLIRSGDLTHSVFERKGEARVKIYGETAVFTGRLINTAHFEGSAFEADEWTTDIFVRRDGRWLCVLSHITTAHQDPEQENMKG